MGVTVVIFLYITMCLITYDITIQNLSFCSFVTNMKPLKRLGFLILLTPLNPLFVVTYTISWISVVICDRKNKRRKN